MPVLSKARWEKFAQCIVAELEPGEAYIEAGYRANCEKHAQGVRMLANPAIADRIKELRALIVRPAPAPPMDAVRFVRTEICTKQGRINAVQDRWDRMKRIIEARAKDPELLGIPGGDTGLIVVVDRRPERVVLLDEKGKPRMSPTGVVINEVRLVAAKIAVDVALLHEMREHEKQAAIEMGEWVEKADVTHRAGISEDTRALAEAVGIEGLLEIRRVVEARMAAKQIPPPQTIDVTATEEPASV